MKLPPILAPSIRFLLSTLAIVLIAGCGNSQESARKELAKLGKDFSAESFLECVANDDKQAVALFIEAGFNANTPGEDGVTALHIAAMKGDADIVKMLLEKGANPNAAVASGTEKGSTPLMAAATGGSLEAVKLLLDKGAQVNAEDGRGLTAQDCTTNLDIVKILRQHGAPLITDVALATLLDQFESVVRTKAIRSMDASQSADDCRKLINEQLRNFQQEQSFNADQLLQARISAFNAVWDAVDKFVLTQSGPIVTDQARQAVKPFVEFRTELQTDPAVQRELLLVAAGKGDANKVQWLLNNHADVNVKNESGFTPLTFAISSKDMKTVQLLLEAGADCSSKQGPYGMTPAMDAVMPGNGSMDILKLILAKKPDVNIVGEKGQTALQVAETANNAEAVALLKEAGATK